MHNLCSNFQNLNLHNFLFRKAHTFFFTSLVCAYTGFTRNTGIYQRTAHTETTQYNLPYQAVFMYFFVEISQAKCSFLPPLGAFFFFFLVGGGQGFGLRMRSGQRWSLFSRRLDTVKVTRTLGTQFRDLQTAEPVSRTVIHVNRWQKIAAERLMRCNNSEGRQIRTATRETPRQRLINTGKQSFNRFCLSWAWTKLSC